jgi:putative hydrolase of the HAD superfamily
MDGPADNEHGRLGCRPDIILFDLDETLCDYATARRRRLAISFKIALRNIPPGDWPNLDDLIDRSIAIAPHGDAHFPELLSQSGVDDPEAIACGRTWFRRHRLHSLTLFPDARSALAAIRANNPAARIGIITNGPADIQREKVTLLGLPPLVDVIVISGEVGVAKPDPAIFTLALDRLAGEVDDAIYLGDAPEVDIGGAKAAGIRAVWMNRDGRSYPAGHPQPDAEVDSLTAFARLVAALPRR